MRKILPILVVALVVFTGCHTVAPVITTPHNDSIVLRHEIQHDSIYIDRIHFEKQKGDTIYLRDTVTQKYFSILNKCDTIYKDKEVVVQLPPEKYIPAFYKWCTAIFWIVVAGGIIYIVVRIVMKTYLRK